MAHMNTESDGHVESLLRSSRLNSENLSNVEMQQTGRRTRHHHGWFSKAAAFPLVRPRYYLATIGGLVVLSILFLLRQHKEALAVRLHSVQVDSLIPFKPSSKPLPPLGTAHPGTIPEFSNHSSNLAPMKAKPQQKWTKPENLTIIALIFYGRPETVSILDCYMKQNLASNGGFLDEVHWAVNTENPDSLQYLDELVKTSTGYKKIVLPSLGFESIWEHAVERGNLYIKIDDDIVYVHEDAIPNLIYSMLKHPEAFDVSANLVNSPSLSWLHYHMGAIHPYLPERKAPDPSAGPSSQASEVWRPSLLPSWEGTNIDFSIGGDENSDAGAPPFQGHRWLPLRDQKNSLMRTPISKTEFDAFGNGWKSWAIAAQQHYSLLQNIEHKEMDRYYFGRSTDETDEHEKIYTMGDSRMNINFLCIWGDDVVENYPFGDVDEPELSWNLPQKLQRPLLINTKAIVAHFTFMTQLDLSATDLLNRWRAYANENVCSEKILPI